MTWLLLWSVLMVGTIVDFSIYVTVLMTTQMTANLDLISKCDISKVFCITEDNGRHSIKYHVLVVKSDGKTLPQQLFEKTTYNFGDVNADKIGPLQQVLKTKCYNPPINLYLIESSGDVVKSTSGINNYGIDVWMGNRYSIDNYTNNISSDVLNVRIPSSIPVFHPGSNLGPKSLNASECLKNIKEQLGPKLDIHFGTVLRSEPPTTRTFTTSPQPITHMSTLPNNATLSFSAIDDILSHIHDMENRLSSLTSALSDLTAKFTKLEDIVDKVKEKQDSLVMKLLDIQ